LALNVAGLILGIAGSSPQDGPITNAVARRYIRGESDPLATGRRRLPARCLHATGQRAPIPYRLKGLGIATVDGPANTHTERFDAPLVIRDSTP